MAYEIQVAVLFGGFAVGFIVWWLALRGCLKLRSMARTGALGEFFAPEMGAPPEEPPGGSSFQDSARVSGLVGIASGIDRAVYLKELRRIMENPLQTMAGVMAQGPIGPILEVVEQTPDSISFVNRNRGRRLGLAVAYDEGRVAVLPPKDSALHSFRVHYELNVGDILDRWTGWLLLFMVAVQLPVVVGLPFALGYFCASSANPNVQVQVVQVLQMVHVLWPPFLFLHLMKRSVQSSKLLFEAFLKAAASEAQRAAERQ